MTAVAGAMKSPGNAGTRKRGEQQDAQSGVRTRNPFRAKDFKSFVYANSTTWACSVSGRPILPAGLGRGKPAVTPLL